MDVYEDSQHFRFSFWFVLLGALLVVPLFISFDVVHRSVSFYPGFQVANNAHNNLITLPFSFVISPVVFFLAVFGGRGFLPLRRWFKFFCVFALWVIALGVYSVVKNGFSVVPYLVQWLLPVILLLSFVRLRLFLNSILLGVYVANFIVVWMVSLHLILSCVFPTGRAGDTFWGVSVYQAYNYFLFVVSAIFYGLTPFFFNTYRKLSISKGWQLSFLSLYALAVMIVSWSLSSREALLLISIGALVTIFYGGRIYSRPVHLFQVVAIVVFLAIGWIGTFSSLSPFSLVKRNSVITSDSFGKAYALQRIRLLADKDNPNYLTAKRGKIFQQCLADFTLLLRRTLADEGVDAKDQEGGYFRFHPETSLLFGASMQKMKHGPHNYYIDVFMWAGLPAFFLMLFAWFFLSVDAWSYFLRKLGGGDGGGRIAGLHGISMIILFTFVVSNNVRGMFRQPYAVMIISMLIAAFWVYSDDHRYSLGGSTKKSNFISSGKGV